MTVKYLDDIATIDGLLVEPCPTSLLDAYGKAKYPTRYLIVFKCGERSYKRRVYSTCYSNVASFWVTFRFQTYYLWLDHYPILKGKN